MGITCRNRIEGLKVYLITEKQRIKSEKYIRVIREEKDGWLYR